MKRAERIDDPTLAWLQAFQGAMAGVWTALPGIVNGLDADMTVSVKPAIQATVTDSKGGRQLVNLPLLIKCPLIFPSAGGFTLTFPVKPGDEVLVIFASRCIDSWWQNGGVQAPAELRLHDLSDGFALPGPKSLPRLISPHASNVQLRTDDGEAIVEITPGHQINIVTTATVNVHSTGNLNLVSDAQVQVQAPAIGIVGNVAISGGTLTHNGKNVGDTHTHTSAVGNGANHTGGPG